MDSRRPMRESGNRLPRIRPIKPPPTSAKAGTDGHDKDLAARNVRHAQGSCRLLVLIERAPADSSSAMTSGRRSEHS